MYERTRATCVHLPDGRVALEYDGVRVGICPRYPEVTWREWPGASAADQRAAA